MPEQKQKRIPVAAPSLNGNEKNYVLECLESTWISSAGRFIPAFEQAVAAYCGVEYAIATCNGTCALHLALTALDIGPGDEVIVPSLTYVATANAVRYTGATPVFIDSEPRTLNLDPHCIGDLVNPRTKAIVVVHLYGHPVDMDSVNAIAERHGLYVIEDAAEALGAKYRGQMIGALGHAAIFSFFGNKIITTGEGGMVVTSNRVMADRIRLLRGQGMDPGRRYWHAIVGFNYRMTNIAAAIGLAQMEQITSKVSTRRQIAQWYRRYLTDLDVCLDLPVEEAWVTHAYWMFNILLKPNVNISRDLMMMALDAEGIETRPTFYPIHTMPPYADPPVTLPIAEDCASRGITLPTFEALTEEGVGRITNACRTFFRQRAGTD